MKNIKKIISVLLATMMIFSMSAISVLAEGEEATTKSTGNLTITDSRSGRTYEAYQIVYGDITGEEGSFVLTNIKWGSGQTAHTAGDKLTEAELNALPKSDATREAIETYINSVTLASSTTYKSAAGEGSYTFTGIPAGWYVIKETTATSGKDDYKSAFLVEVIGDATAVPKGSGTSMVKNVDDINDTTAAASIEMDSADHDIGDTITYTLTAKIGDDLTDYEKYELIFTDNMSKGLTYKEVTKVTVDGIEKAVDIVTVADGTYSGNTEAYAGGTTKTFKIADILADSVGAQAGSEIKIKYTCILNADAVIGSAGNPNKAYLEYSNNPDVETEHGKTPEDINIVFTYKTVFNKVDKDKEPVSGADFKLEKKVGNAWVDVTSLHTGDGAVNPTKAVAGNVFTFAGLDDGDYKLTETATPKGYNSIEPIEFTITAEHDLVSNNPALTALRGTDGQKFTMTPNTSEGSLTVDIVNEKGTTLPETGGMGTTLFYIVGAILVIGAGVILVTRRRMSAQ